jgi:hypothetical protein
LLKRASGSVISRPAVLAQSAKLPTGRAKSNVIFACLHRLRSFRPSLSQTSRAATRRRPESLISQGAWPIPGDNRFRGRKKTRLRLFLARTGRPGLAMMNFGGRLRRHAVGGSGSITTTLLLGPIGWQPPEIDETSPERSAPWASADRQAHNHLFAGSSPSSPPN